MLAEKSELYMSNTRKKLPDHCEFSIISSCSIKNLHLQISEESKMLFSFIYWFFFNYFCANLVFSKNDNGKTTTFWLKLM